MPSEWLTVHSEGEEEDEGSFQTAAEDSCSRDAIGSLHRRCLEILFHLCRIRLHFMPRESH